MKDIRIATASMQSKLYQTQQNLEVMHRLIRQASVSGVKILCFPEMNITGYCNDESIWDVAETIPGPSSNQVLDFSQKYKITILAGLPEKNQSNLFISHLIASPFAPLGIYRKLYLGPPEKTVFSQGTTSPVFHDQELCVGIQLCYDAHFPELTTLMTHLGLEILFIPHASPNGTSEQKLSSWMRHLTARAYDNSVFVIACNASGKNCAGLTFPALSLAIDPSGNVMQKSMSQSELMIVDLKTDDLDHVRSHEMRYFFANRRTDIYNSLMGTPFSGNIDKTDSADASHIPLSVIKPVTRRAGVTSKA